MSKNCCANCIILPVVRIGIQLRIVTTMEVAGPARTSNEDQKNGTPSNFLLVARACRLHEFRSAIVIALVASRGHSAPKPRARPKKKKNGARPGKCPTLTQHISTTRGSWTDCCHKVSHQTPTSEKPHQWWCRRDEFLVCSQVIKDAASGRIFGSGALQKRLSKKKLYDRYA